MRLEIIQALQVIIIALLSYVPMVMITGWFEAWVAKKCGDDVPEQMGFLTFDPIMHFNLVGFGFLLVGKLLGDYLPFFKEIPGWGRYMPLNPSEFGKWRVVLQFSARAIAHFFLLFLSLFILIFCMNNGFLTMYWDVVPQASSFVHSLLYILKFFHNQNLLLCIIYFSIAAFRSLIFFYFPDFYIFSAQHIVLGMLLLFGIVLICAELFRFIIMNLMALFLYALIV